MLVLAAVLVIAAAVYWAASALAIARVLRAVRGVRDLRAPAPPRWPRVSVVVPARDEERTVASALRSRLADPYPDLEVVFVDDRSSDATGALADALAREDGRLQVVHVTALPDGWLGKVHAMQRGAERATGEWLLFSDADVHIAPGTLERVIAHAEHAGIDHVSVMPELTSAGFLLRATILALIRVVCVGGRLWAVSDPRSSASSGIGAFNLVRRAALARTPGLAWLKMEIGDDVALGMMLKRHGARQAVLDGRGAVSLDFYPSYRALVRATEKNGASFPFPVLAAVQLVLLALDCGPLVGLVSGNPALAVTGAATWLVAAVASVRLARWLGLGPAPALVPWLGLVGLAWAMLRSGVLALARGGVLWRGTFYPTRTVRAGLRVTLRGLREAPPA